MTCELARGRYANAYALGEEATAEMTLLTDLPPELASTYATMAVCAWELGNDRLALSLEHDSASLKRIHPDASADCAYVAAIHGDRERARILLAKAVSLARHGKYDIGAMGSIEHATVILRLVESSGQHNAILLPPVLSAGADPDMRPRRLLLRALVALASGSIDSVALASEGLDAARAQGAERYESRFEVLVAAAERDRTSLGVAIERASESGSLALLEIADGIGTVLDLCDPMPHRLQESIRQLGGRWLPVLRRELTHGNTPCGHAAARLLSAFGLLEDVPRLTAYERTYGHRSRVKGLGKALVRRTSPTLLLHDLGRTVYSVGN